MWDSPARDTDSSSGATVMREDRDIDDTAPDNVEDSAPWFDDLPEPAAAPAPEYSATPLAFADSPSNAELDVIIEASPEDLDHTVRSRWIAGGVASLILHIWFFSSLGSVAVDDHEIEYAIPIETRMLEDVVKQEDVEVINYELANPDEQEKEQQVALNARSVGQLKTETPIPQVEPPLPEVQSTEVKSMAPVFDIPEGVELDDVQVVQGTTGEGLIQLDAALDRVTWEIAANLKEKKVLQIWLIDASASVLPQRKEVSKRLRRIYGELQALEKAGQIPNQDRPLLSVVATFGEKTSYITPDPTARLDDLVEAFDKAPTDESGVENVYGAVRNVVEKWRHIRFDHHRRLLITIITDEAGDDFANLQPAIGQVNRIGGKVFVIGPPAVFGQRQGFVPYVAPEDGKTYQLPVDLGPESPVIEQVKLPFWFGGPQHDYISAGLGPYGLARLVSETGGVYFMTNMTTTAGLAPTGTYTSDSMKLYLPDYKFDSPEEFLRELSRRPIRNAVVTAANLSLKYKALGTPDLELRVNPNNYLQTLGQAQQSVAISTAMIENILQAFPPSLESVYAKEESIRWRMSYNLALGRLITQRLRCYEYNYACAQLKLLGTQDIATKVNHWIFRPDKDLNYAPGMKKQQQLAEALLKRCIEEAPGTPWAILAARELQYPVGIKIIDRFDPPPPPPPAMTGNAVKSKKGVLLLADDRKRQPTPKPAPPPPPPKLPKL